MAMIGTVMGGVKSGHAEAELLAASEGYSPGTPMQLGIQLKLDSGWHTYWMNPGESGTTISIDWVLPENWVAGKVLHPVPVRFLTGELAGFGYEKEVVMPVSLTPPTNANGKVTIQANVSWLTCDDSSCMPGQATLTMELEQRIGPGSGADEIAEGLALVPAPMTGAKLDVTTQEKVVTLDVTLPEGLDATGSDVFPATASVLDIRKPIKLWQHGSGWRTQVPLNEYASGPPEKLEIVLANGKLESPLMLTWESGS